MREFRARTLDLVIDLDDEQLIGPRLAIVNPPLWEIGHIAWFAEYWILRQLGKKPPTSKMGTKFTIPPMLPTTLAGTYYCPRSRTPAAIWTTFSIAALSISTELPNSRLKRFTFICSPRSMKACMPKRWRTRGKPSATPHRDSQPTDSPERFVRSFPRRCRGSRGNFPDRRDAGLSFRFRQRKMGSSRRNQIVSHRSRAGNQWRVSCLRRRRRLPQSSVLERTRPALVTW